MGIAGALNDNAEITAPVYSFMPNDYGLFNMAGNVCEWVMDIYRPMTAQDANDLNPFRGNQFKKLQLDEEGYPVEKDSLGRLVYVPVTAEENTERRNYRKSDYRGFKDGGAGDSYDDFTSEDFDEFGEEVVYNYGKTSLINNNSRVYKGGSWNDRAFYLTPGARRWMVENQSNTSEVKSS
jgi:formylglycine-generating enzyme required for sulfatase activity